MMRRSAVLLVAGVLNISAAEAGERIYEMPGYGGVLILPVPTGWVEELRRPSDEGPPAINFHGAGREDFRVFILPFPGAGADVAGMVRGAARGIAPLAAEEQIEVKPLGGDVRGYWFGYTDRSLAGTVPPEGEYIYTVQGAALVGDLALTFTVLTNDRRSAAIAAALRMVRGARYHGGS
ncbi:MAG TPA: hypothetical protein ENO23_06460 [Alphaproteobacteria bacterium]|nr:hypothetical protein [Alphaproteobacteria bacterium]